jgi:hypothetical protein
LIIFKNGIISNLIVMVDQIDNQWL